MNTKGKKEQTRLEIKFFKKISGGHFTHRFCCYGKLMFFLADALLGESKELSEEVDNCAPESFDSACIIMIIIGRIKVNIGICSRFRKFFSLGCTTVFTSLRLLCSRILPDVTKSINLVRHVSVITYRTCVCNVTVRLTSRRSYCRYVNVSVSRNLSLNYNDFSTSSTLNTISKTCFRTGSILAGNYYLNVIKSRNCGSLSGNLSLTCGTVYYCVVATVCCAGGSYVVLGYRSTVSMSCCGNCLGVCMSSIVCTSKCLDADLSTGRLLGDNTVIVVVSKRCNLSMNS